MKSNYLIRYILSFEEIVDFLNLLCTNHPNIISKEKEYGLTHFLYKIESYKIGKGKKHVIIFAATHGSEIVTVHFILKLLSTIIYTPSLYNIIKDIYTFHIIPILNPEGYIISSSSYIYTNNVFNNTSLENLAKKYIYKSLQDNFNASNNICKEKEYKKVLNTSANYLNNLHLKEKVINILDSCNLDLSILPVFSANGLGIDPNSNSIHKFLEIKKLRTIQKYASLRYNDISVTMPSPMSYPGKYSLDKNSCPENVYLYNYISKLYKLNLDITSSDNLIAIFSYHSAGGEIYSYPDKEIASRKQISLHTSNAKIYSNITKYKLINENLKYGVMDYYRAYLKDVCSLTIELSSLSSNPIGPFANLKLLDKEIDLNIKALFETLKLI